MSRQIHQGVEPVLRIESSSVNGLDTLANKELAVGLVEVGVSVDESSLIVLRRSSPAPGQRPARPRFSSSS